MRIEENSLWQSDLDRTIDAFPEFDAFDNTSIMITGAAGLICSSVVDILLRRNIAHGGRTTVLVAGRWYQEMADRFGSHLNHEWLKYVNYDASRNDNRFDKHCDYIIHGASNAHPALIAKEPVETMLSNFIGLHQLLEYARDNGTKRVLYISSSEIYGKTETDYPHLEDEYGSIDLLVPRNSYSVGKRAAETLCASFSQEYGTDVLIARPGHIYGPTASPNDTRVASAWAYAAARNEDIVMKSDGRQIRSYCYCLDCASALLTILLRGKSASAYNISNPDSVISIAELAETMSMYGAVQLRREIPTNIEATAFNPMINSALDSSRLESLGWRGLFNSRDGIDHTISIVRALIK